MLDGGGAVLAALPELEGLKTSRKMHLGESICTRTKGHEDDSLEARQGEVGWKFLANWPNGEWSKLQPNCYIPSPLLLVYSLHPRRTSACGLTLGSRFVCSQPDVMIQVE